MKSKRIFGVVLIIIGIVLILFSRYINMRVEEGKGIISSAQSTVNQGNTLFSATPETKAVGKAITGSAQSKINAGQAEISSYEELERWLMIGGIGLIIIGAGVVFIGGRKRSNR